MEVVATVSCRVCVYVCARARAYFWRNRSCSFVLISHSFPTRLFYGALFDRVNDTPPPRSGARRIFSCRITNEIDLCSKCASPRHGRRVRANDDEHFPPAIIIHNVQRDFRVSRFYRNPFTVLAAYVIIA